MPVPVPLSCQPFGLCCPHATFTLPNYLSAAQNHPMRVAITVKMRLLGQAGWLTVGGDLVSTGGSGLALDPSDSTKCQATKFNAAVFSFVAGSCRPSDVQRMAQDACVCAHDAVRGAVRCPACSCAQMYTCQGCCCSIEKNFFYVWFKIPNHAVLAFTTPS